MIVSALELKALRAFVVRVNARAEQTIELTCKVEGAHYNAMLVELARLGTGEAAPVSATNVLCTEDIDVTEEIGQLADKVDNYIAAAKLPMPAKFHLEQLQAGLGEISSKLKEIYTALSGDNPWESTEQD